MVDHKKRVVKLTDIGDEHTAGGQAVWNAFIAALTWVTVELTSSISKLKEQLKRDYISQMYSHHTCFSKTFVYFNASFY